ncbi:uncharacterized protein A4U43_C05F12310 [Asparagus officinalis]|uniref:Uncharacterized protein n=1 Tax=Asparagus officinalis TaxID=4686 RepID=A0A5P1ERP5_ASPOF|nr:uncharacterized protein A4U43_C05F12310 [Asparagus officinalis]
MRALGIPPLSRTFFRTLPMHERKSKGSKKKVCEDDDVCLPPMDDNFLSSSSEDDNDDLEDIISICVLSLIVTCNAYGSRTQVQKYHTIDFCAREEDLGSVPSTRRNVRGATRGKGTERLVRQLGHAISVPIPSSSGAPEGEHVTSLANEIGKEI